MTANPWDKFFWNDWETDPGLKLCSLAAQGLWMRMLCICAKAEPKGYLLVAGQPLSPADLASYAGKSEAEVETLLSELELRKVFSRDRKQRIYSRRMVKAKQKTAIARENGKKGGNPSLLYIKRNSGLDNQQLKPPDKTQEPEAKSLFPEPIGSEPQTAHEALTAMLWREGLKHLTKLGLSDGKARAQIGRWLKAAKPEELLRAIEQAARNGTRDPIPYITAALKPKDKGWRKNGTGYHVMHGSEPYDAWREEYRKQNSARQWEFPDKPGTEAVVPTLWPSQNRG